jgi:hypothetical protein
MFEPRGSRWDAGDLSAGLPAFAHMTRISFPGILGWEWVDERPRAADEFDRLGSR